MREKNGERREETTDPNFLILVKEQRPSVADDKEDGAVEDRDGDRHAQCDVGGPFGLPAAASTEEVACSDGGGDGEGEGDLVGDGARDEED